MLFIESRSSATKTSKRCIVFYILVHKPNSCLNNFPDMSPRNDVNVIKIAVISSLSDFPFLVVYARFWLEIYSVTCFYMCESVIKKIRVRMTINGFTFRKNPICIKHQIFNNR